MGKVSYFFYTKEICMDPENDTNFCQTQVEMKTILL